MNYQDIDRIVARHFGVKQKFIHKNAQFDAVIKVRAAAIRLNHDVVGYSFNRLSKIYHKRSHNTAGNAYRTACNLYDTDKDFHQLYDAAHADAIRFFEAWKPRKQCYNLHYRLRKKQIRVETRSRTVSITPEQEQLISGSKQIRSLLKKHSYSVQYAIL
jgi:hypothetical protein